MVIRLTKLLKNNSKSPQQFITSGLIRSTVFFSIITRGNGCQRYVIISSEQRSTSSLEFSELLHPLSITAYSYAGCKPTETRFKRNGKPRMATENAESPLECDPARLESQTGTSYLERGPAVCAGHRGFRGDA